jgi:transposase
LYFDRESRRDNGFTSKVLCLVSSRLLSFIPRTLEVLNVLSTGDHVTIEAASRRCSAECTACGSPSRRVHSSYLRTLHDLPSHGRQVIIHVAARRFRCLNASCARKTFAERLDAAAAYARRTKRLGDLQHYLALALGGAAGARLAERLAVPVSADTLLRVAAATTDCRSTPSTPRVLAVDDWAWRRGHRYGTILVDLERNQVVDLLPDRQAETLAAWLREHPCVEVVARDRAGAYADGVRQGAPDAVQVADRWHLLRNLGEAVRTVIDRQHLGIRRVAQQIAEETVMCAGSVTTPAPDISRPTAAERRSQDAFVRRQARYEEAAQLNAAGVSIKRIAAMVGAERKTIRRWLRAGGAPRWSKPRRVGMLGPYRAHLDRRWNEGCHNAARLWREIVALGFTGRPGTVRQWAGRRRKNEPQATTVSGTHEVTGQPPSTRRIARLLMTEDGNALPEAEKNFVSRLLGQVPSLAACVAVAQRLSRLLRRKSKESLDDVLEDAAGTALKTFVMNLRPDLPAVQAALDLPWTTSPAEGQINRLKMLKRTMYGRAGFRLLRARVLHAA